MSGNTSGLRAAPGARGMSTVELAVGLVTVTVLAAVLITLTMLGVAQAGVAESSAQIARQLARGDQQAARQASERAPGSVRVEQRSGGVSVTVVAEAPVLGIGKVPVTATAWAAYEPGQHA